jgi:hypothetical protein
MAKKQRGKEIPPFTRSPYIDRSAHVRPYDPFAQRLRPGTREAAGAVPITRIPVSRCLKIYTQDPATPRQNIAVATLQVPYEPLKPGPTGCVMWVIDKDETPRRKPKAPRRKPKTAPEPPEPLDLDALGVLAPTGAPPSTGDFQFAQQMTYAVAMVTYDRFRQALGRTPDFSFGPKRSDEPDDPDGMVKLHIYPHGMKEDNAYYDPDRGALRFGYTFANKRAVGMNQPGGIIYTSLSHDVVVHETAHALLDGMRAKFMLPSNGDVDAFHEGFADLVAVFQRFQYKELVRQAIKQSDDLNDLGSGLLTDIMRQWGEATGEDNKSPRKALRNAVVAAGGPEQPVAREFYYRHGKEAHDLGAVLVAAVFDAFRWIYSRKTASLRAAGRRDGEPPSADLVDLLTGEAVRLAHQFLDIVIRAVDYCPPVDLTFGEYLRALVTADFDLVPEDPWGYREALVQAFRRYRITVDDVDDLSEESLLWRTPTLRMGPIEGLAFNKLVHQREPGQISDLAERRRRADEFGRFVTRPEHLEHFGLARPVRRPGLHIEPPVIESIRTIRRIGPDDSLTFDLVGEVTQRRKVGRRWFYGGATVIIDATGVVRYALAKSVLSKRRQDRFKKNLAAKPALYSQLFEQDQPRTGALLRNLHAPRRAARVSMRRRRRQKR